MWVFCSHTVYTRKCHNSTNHFFTRSMNNPFITIVLSGSCALFTASSICSAELIHFRLSFHGNCRRNKSNGIVPYNWVVWHVCNRKGSNFRFAGSLEHSILACVFFYAGLIYWEKFHEPGFNGRIIGELTRCIRAHGRTGKYGESSSESECETNNAENRNE